MNAPSGVYGSTRNLTSQFRRLRDEFKRTAAAEQIDGPLLPSGLAGSSSSSARDPEAPGVPQGPPPAWVQRSERIRMDLNTLKARLDKLKEAHTRALKVTFDVDSDNEAQAQAEALTRELQSGFKRANDEIKAMQAEPGAEDAQVRDQVQRQLGRALMVLTREFRGEETRYLNKVDEMRGFAAGSSLAMVESALPAESDTANVDPGFTQDQTRVVDTLNLIAEERGREIQTICENIAELAAIMRDMAVLVVEQGTILDRIDHNIAEAASKIAVGVTHVGQAAATQKKSQMMLCIIALIVIIVLLLIIVIVRQTMKSS